MVEGEEAQRRVKQAEGGGRGAAMNDSEPEIPDGGALGRRSLRAPERELGDRTPPRAFLGDTRGDVVCGVCWVPLQLGHRAVLFPCGQGRYVLHARYVVETLARVAAPGPLRCPAVNCGAQHPRRDALEAAVQADPGLRNRAARMGGGTASDEDLRNQGLWYGRDQNSLGVGPPLDAVSSEDLRQRLATGKRVQPATVGGCTCAP